MTALPPKERAGAEARERLTRSAGVVSAAVLASRVLGLGREVLLAYLFPAGLTLEAHNAAFRIPNMLRDLFGEGALSKAFVTVFSETEVREGDEATWRLASRVMNLMLVAACAFAVLGIVFAPYVVAAMLPGEGFDTPLPPDESFGFVTKRDLTVFLVRILFPFIPLVALAAVSMGVLNSKHRFGLPALSSAFFNVASIAVGVTGYFVGPRLGYHPVVGMTVGVLAGGLVQWLVQLPQMRALGFRWTAEMSLSDPGVRKIGRLIGPATVGVAAVQINVFVNTVLASFGDGWLSWINVSFRLMYLPIGIFGVAVSTANLPALARHAAAGERAEFRDTLSHALRLILMLTIPSSVGLAVLSDPIMRLIYQHGAFTAYDAEMSARALFYYALGLCGYSAVKVVTDAFYAIGDTLTPLKISCAAIAFNLAFSSLLILGFGWDHRALALSTSTAVMGNCATALLVLRRRTGGLDGWAVLATAAKALAASAAMAVVSWFVAHQFAPEHTLGRLAQVSASILAGLLTFSLLAHLLRLREFSEILQLVPIRVIRGRS
jgi:putative peptidoglycan lipid II flippase